MRERYVHTLRYHYNRWNHRPTKKMFPVSYGPFRDEDAAREWIRQSGITTATTLMAMPAAENIKIPHSAPPFVPKGLENAALAHFQPQSTRMR
jgi:hypothetical protein